MKNTKSTTTIRKRKVARGWQCPICKTVYSPFESECTCSKRTTIPPYKYPTFPDVYPTHPWPEIPSNPGWPISPSPWDLQPYKKTWPYTKPWENEIGPDYPIVTWSCIRV